MDKSSSVNKPEPTTALFAKRFVMSSVQVRKAVSLDKHWTTLGSENFSEKKSVIFNAVIKGYQFYTSNVYPCCTSHVLTIDANI